MSAKSFPVVIAFCMLSSSCLPSNPHANSVDSISLYADGRIESAWLFAEGDVVSNDQSFSSDYRSVSVFSVRENSTDKVDCVLADDDVIGFGIPTKINEGVEFACGPSKFSILECFDTGCQTSRVSGEWRTGVPPKFSRVPFQFIYSRCIGITSISLTSYGGEQDYIATDLELRRGIGLLAKPETEECDSDPIAKLLSDSRTDRD